MILLNLESVTLASILLALPSIQVQYVLLLSKVSRSVLVHAAKGLKEKGYLVLYCSTPTKCQSWKHCLYTKT